MEGFKNNIELQKEDEFMTLEEFEQQFNEEHLLEVEGNEPVPYTTVIPENPTSEDWVVYVGGFSQGKESYLDEIQNLAQSGGRKVLFTNPTKGIEEKDTDSAVDVPETIMNKSTALNAVLEAVGAVNVDLVGHSQGAAVITTFSVTHPGRARKIILECPAGLLGGNDSQLRIMGRFFNDKVSSTVQDPKQFFSKAGFRVGGSFTSNFVKDFVFRLKQEIPGATTLDIAPLLKKIKKESEETEIILLNANKDKAFPVKRLEETLGDNPLNEYIDRWVMYENKKASHSAPAVEHSLYNNKNASLMAPAVERAGLLRKILE